MISLLVLLYLNQFWILWLDFSDSELQSSIMQSCTLCTSSPACLTILTGLCFGLIPLCPFVILPVWHSTNWKPVFDFTCLSRAFKCFNQWFQEDSGLWVFPLRFVELRHTLGFSASFHSFLLWLMFGDSGRTHGKCLMKRKILQLRLTKLCNTSYPEKSVCTFPCLSLPRTFLSQTPSPCSYPQISTGWEKISKSTKSTIFYTNILIKVQWFKFLSNNQSPSTSETCSTISHTIYYWKAGWVLIIIQYSYK